ncbi:MAG TPA: hypothetical protein PKG98_13475 [Myxococcota bacterium]|nr:hypothetical protein [Myxococcota bacterium]
MDYGGVDQDTSDPRDTAELEDVNEPEDNVTPADTSTDPDAVEPMLTPPDLRTTYVYRLYTGGPGEYVDMPGLLQPEAVEYDQDDWFVGQVENFTESAKEGLNVYVSPALDEDMGVGLFFKATEVFNGQAEPQFWYTFEPAIAAYANIPVGVKQTVTATGELGFSFDQTQPVEAKVEYTLVSTDESVEIPFGTVEGCFYYSVDAWEGINGADLQGPMHVDVYAKPDFGIVAISMVPGYGAMELVSVQFPE